MPVEKKGKKMDSLFGGGLDVSGGGRAHHGLSGVRSTGPGGRQTLSSRTMSAGMASWTLAVMMSHAL